jgi:methylenetetrahydrofolate--tRNA-(uracil-5-)-methyltransferase
MGLLAGINAASLIENQTFPHPPPAETALGALVRHLVNSDPKHFQPTNVNFGLFPPVAQKMKKRERA